MPIIVCPYCNSTTNKPLKFCISCGRSISTEESGKLGNLKQRSIGGLTRRLKVNFTPASFKRAKKSYNLQRMVREFFHNFLLVLLVVLLYYAGAKMILKETSGKDLDSALYRIMMNDH